MPGGANDRGRAAVGGDERNRAQIALWEREKVVPNLSWAARKPFGLVQGMGARLIIDELLHGEECDLNCSLVPQAVPQILA